MSIWSRLPVSSSICTIAACVLAAAPAGAQTPDVVNGTLESRAATQPVAREIATITSRTSGPAWIGYAVPLNRADRETGCWAFDGFSGRARVGPVKLESSESIFVLYRIPDRSVQKVRIASPECPLDAGGLTLYWLTGVRATESIDWLETLATGDTTRSLANSATMAIALHADRHATDRLIALARDARNAMRSFAPFFSLAPAATLAVISTQL